MVHTARSGSHYQPAGYPTDITLVKDQLNDHVSLVRESHTCPRVSIHGVLNALFISFLLFISDFLKEVYKNYNYGLLVRSPQEQ